jgi:hypothetical protein
MRHVKLARAALAVLLAAALSAAGGCGEGGGSDVPGISQPAVAGSQSGDIGPAAEPEGKKPWSGSGMSDEQIGREAQKLKDKGIVDEHGVPASGVDLNDYPGLG